VSWGLNLTRHVSATHGRVDVQIVLFKAVRQSKAVAARRIFPVSCRTYRIRRSATYEVLLSIFVVYRSPSPHSRCGIVPHFGGRVEESTRLVSHS